MAIIIRELVVRATVEARPEVAPRGREHTRHTKLSPQQLDIIIAAVMDALRAGKER